MLSLRNLVISELCGVGTIIDKETDTGGEKGAEAREEMLLREQALEAEPAFNPSIRLLVCNFRYTNL